MANQREILFIVYPGFEMLDLAGPMGVFSTATRLLDGSQAYALTTASLNGGIIQSREGLSVVTQALSEIPGNHVDTAVVVGADERPLRDILEDGQLTSWLADQHHIFERVASVCSGAFLLAAAGLLEHKRATCHWGATERLKRAFPGIDVEADALFIQDGRIWTSAGVTTGIDMTLEMVRRDFGHALASDAARQLVVFAHRPGSQSQFSRAGAAQATPNQKLRDLIVWLSSHLHQSIDVSTMALRAGMSARSFQRHFTKEIGVSPGAFLTELRLERAKDLLIENQTVGATAIAVGYRSEAAFRKAFSDRHSVSPSIFADLHCPKVSPATL